MHKTLLIAVIFNLSSLVIPFSIYAQLQENSKFSDKNWQLTDFANDSVYGASVSKAYAELLKGKKSHQVIVAVIDTGLDTTHEDLQGHIWTNKKETPGNNIDDDHNGYIDDVHGWNFLGSKDGRNITEESYENEREYFRLHPSFAEFSDSLLMDKDERQEYAYYLKLKGIHVKDSAYEANIIKGLTSIIEKMEWVYDIWRKILKNDSINLSDIKKGVSPDTAAGTLRTEIINLYSLYNEEPEYPLEAFLARNKRNLYKEQSKLDSLILDPNAMRRGIVGDDPGNINNRNYGNNNVGANMPSHGTHVAGIIAAIRNNNKGFDGIADNVLIMSVRAIPDQDERDKDVALAIRYAVDNGAKIINMSFGKPLSPNKNWVDEAVKYALSKDVLLVSIAQNEGRNIDSTDEFPSPVFSDTKEVASNFITVAASAGGPQDMLAAPFSNYGTHRVNLFAPGVNIYSTIPENKYAFKSGTSMAAPVVAGIAAMMLEYYPSLSARQVKYILEKTVTKCPGVVVFKPGTNNKVLFSTLSATGGIVNAYNALKLAATIKGERKVQKFIK